LIDPQLIEQLDNLLNTTAAHAACSHNATDPSTQYSFWTTLDVIASQANLANAPKKREELTTLIANTKNDLRRLRSFAKEAPCPIVAVCGLLNSGKSSLVAGFLSPAGRRRVLVGVDDESGTHRFVIWLPQSWRSNQELWTMTLEQIKDVFGHLPEELGSDPSEAHRQYNGLHDSASTILKHDQLKVPLVATDPMLDQLQIGLMDCPDVQSGVYAHDPDAIKDFSSVRSTEHIADERVRILLSGLRMASGLVLVAQSNMIRDRTMQKLSELLREQLPSIKTFIAVNRVPKRYTANDIATEVDEHYQLGGLTEAYMAYDFRGPDVEDRLPPSPANWIDSIEPALDSNQSNVARIKLPIFVSISSSSGFRTDNQPNDMDYLLALRSKLDLSQLTQNLIASIRDRTLTNLQLCKQEIDSYVVASSQRNKRVYDVIAAAILDFASKDGDGTLRLQLSKEIVEQIQNSLERTAPYWAKPSQYIGRWSGKLLGYSKAITNRIPMLPSMGRKMTEAVEWVRGRFRSGETGSLMTNDQLARSIRRNDAAGDFPILGNQIADDPLHRACSRVMERFQEESHARLSDEQLDRATEALWKQMTWKQKLKTGVAPVTLISAPLIAAVTIPFDFGASHVLVFATAKELLLAGVASAGLFMMHSEQFPELAEGQAAWVQLSDLFAIACDEFGRARPADADLPKVQVDNQRRSLLKSNTSTAIARPAVLNINVNPNKDFSHRFTTALNAIQQSAT
jgi:hypothetical protein